MLRSPRIRLALLVIVLGAVAATALSLGAGALGSRPSAAALGFWAGAAPFTVLVALGTAAFLPRPVLSIAAGALFGLPLGLCVAVIGPTLGAGLAFGLGRALGRDAVRPLLRRPALAALDRRLSLHGLRSVLLCRLLPGVPFAAVNYAAAFSGARLGPFLGGTALGVVPGAAVYAAAGASAASPSPAVLWAFGLGAVAFAVVGLLRRRAVRRALPAPPGPGAVS